MDYSKIGLKAGLEIHQQLDTGKLFSRTPSLLRSDNPDYEIMRKLHKVAGESGEIDVAVEHEASLDKEFIYQGYNDTISLVELDEEPPREIDSEALEVALQICLLLNCKIYQNNQIMRKTVIDGSNTSGFQRTVLIGYDGFVETSFGKVGIESIALEEDAARIISREEKKNVYRLDRLGIPLVEIMTKPEMKTPEEVKETALKIGDILRACKVKRGIGTIRQDVNISIKGHDRVEIKGFQDAKMMIQTIDSEIVRQQSDEKKNGEVRRALKDGTSEFLRPMPGAARMYPETDLPLLKISLDRINKIKKNLPKLRSDVRGELEKKGLNGEMINLIVKNNLVEEFNALMNVYKDAGLIGKMLTLWRFKKEKNVSDKTDEGVGGLDVNILEDILIEVKKGTIEKFDVQRVMFDISNGKSLEEAVKIEKASDDEVELQIRKIIKEKPGLSDKAYMGIVMKELRGKIDGRRAMEIIKRILD